MPNLASLIERGVMGDLATLHPPCAPLLWTSISTGHTADRHGVLDAQEPDPVTSGVRPVTRASLTAPHLWDLLAREGLRCQSIGWPVTHPAAHAAESACVSDGFFPKLDGSIHPPELESTIAPLRFDPQEWTGDELALFVPEMDRVDQDKDRRLAQLAVLLAEDVTTHAAATTLFERAPWDFSAVWFGAAGRARDLSSTGSDPIYAEAVNGACRFLDLMLGRLLSLAGPDCLTILVSARGARSTRGILCAAGPGIAPDDLAFGSALLDIAPTILGRFGFAQAEGMPGRAIPEICPVTASRTLREVDASASAVPASINAEIAELEALGYTDTVAAAHRPQVESVCERRNYHLAQVLMSQRRVADAVPILEKLVSQKPESPEFRLTLAHAYFLTANHAQCRRICAGLLAQFPKHPLAPLAQAHMAIAQGDYREARQHLASSDGFTGITAALRVSLGEAYLLLGDWDDAADSFRSAIEADSGLAEAHEALARALLNSAQYSAAADAALDAIRLRYDLAPAHKTLADALRALGRTEESAQALVVYESLRRALPA